MVCNTKISVIVPVYNVEKYLSRCIDSIIKQTLNDIEIILATDGPESCNTICEKYAKNDNRIKVLYNPGSYGKAFNMALASANGEYIGIVEADDWCKNTMFEKMYKKAVEYSADVVKCGFYFAFDKKKRNSVSVPSKMLPEDFSIFDYPEFLESQPAVWSCIYKKDFLINNNIKMIEERQSFIDTPFHHETLYKANKYILLKEPLYYYYQDNENQSVQNVNVLDVLKSERHSYQLITQDNNRYNELKEGFLLSTVSHLLWNYERLKTEEQKNTFWLEAHNYLNSIDLSGIQLTYVKSYFKEFYENVKNRRHKPEKYIPKAPVLYTIKLLNLIPLFSLLVKPNKVKIMLFNIIPLLKIQQNGVYEQTYKLFGLLTILMLKKIIK